MPKAYFVFGAVAAGLLVVAGAGAKGFATVVAAAAAADGLFWIAGELLPLPVGLGDDRPLPVVFLGDTLPLTILPALGVTCGGGGCRTAAMMYSSTQASNSRATTP